MRAVEREMRNSSPSFPPVELGELHDAPGEDGLSTELVKLCFNLVADTILSIVNGCFRLNYFPAAWKQARVCIIKKGKKESYREIKSFRPISVLNTFSKVFEKIVHKRLTWLATESNWFSE